MRFELMVPKYVIFQVWCIKPLCHMSFFERGGIEPPTALTNSFTVSLLTIRISLMNNIMLPTGIEPVYLVLHTSALTIWATEAIGKSRSRTCADAMQKRYTTSYIIFPRRGLLDALY